VTHSKPGDSRNRATPARLDDPQLFFGASMTF